jgi:streptogramin lyase
MTLLNFLNRRCAYLMNRSSLLNLPLIGRSRTWLLLAIAIGIAFTLSSANPKPQTAHAAGIPSPILSPTSGQPWGVALDGSNHLWVAQPNCDSSPVCTNPPGTGKIAEYDATTLNKLNEFTPLSPNIYSPIFLAIDSGGNIWFTDPSHGAIGKLVPGTNTWTEFSISSQFSGAVPYDLVLDQHGHLWFTDYANGAIGEFDPTNNTIIGEARVPTSGAILYGIAIAPDGKIWFAENNNFNIGSFTPPASGTLSTANITEYTVQTDQQHLITVDKNGNVWFSTGFRGQIGELPSGSSTAKTFCVSQKFINSPHISGISVDNNTGFVWFDDSINTRVGYLDPTQYNNDCATPNSVAGVTDTTYTAGDHPHDGLLVDGTGNVFFTLQFGSQVGRIPAGTISPSTSAGPTAKTWYFAEGRVGGGFSEFLTLSNPDSAHQCLVNIQYLLRSGSPVTKHVTIPAASRLTESVPGDLGTWVNGRGIDVATIVTNDPSSLCQGFVAERPMYFNFFNVKSGNDVIGATHTASSFYFADIPSGGSYASFITLLNPPGGQMAHITVTYYAGGSQVKTQSLSINSGTRGTISSQAISLPRHTAAVVQSDQPVVAERPSYFRNVSGGIAGSVSGASSVIGSQSVQQQWFVAEGTTGTNSVGGKTQENLVISNVDPSTSVAAQVIISLQYPDGTVQSFPVNIASKSQLIWDVNAHHKSGASNDVSANIVSTLGAGIVVERQMFFKYVHPAYGTKLQATGVTDVTGQAGTYKSYSFAEGYTTTGYDEWLTLQNPTASQETIYITLNNGYARTFTTSVTVGAHSRYTQDIKSLVRAHLVQSGNGSRAYEVSMTVQTLDNSLFVAERPMYWNTAGTSFATQGGSDVFGYNGS